MNVPLPDEKSSLKISPKMKAAVVVGVLVIGVVVAAMMRREIEVSYHVSFLKNRLAEENIPHEFALAQMDPPVTERLLGYLNDPGFEAKASVIRVLSNIRPVEEKTVDVLVDQMRNGDADVSRYAAEALISVGTEHPGVVESLTEVVLDPDAAADTRSAAMISLQQLRTEDSAAFAAFLVSLMANDPGAPMTTIYGALISCGDAAVPHLVRLLDNESVHHRNGAIRSLTALGAEAQPAVSALIESMHNEADVESRYLAAEALRRIGDGSAEVISAYRRVIETEPASSAGVASVRAIAELAPEASETLELLNEMIQPGQPHLQRRMALDLVTGIGPAATDMLPTLRVIAVEEEGITRSFARRAIFSITGQEMEPSTGPPPVDASVTR